MIFKKKKKEDYNSIIPKELNTLETVKNFRFRYDDDEFNFHGTLKEVFDEARSRDYLSKEAIYKLRIYMLAEYKFYNGKSSYVSTFTNNMPILLILLSERNSEKEENAPFSFSKIKERLWIDEEKDVKFKVNNITYIINKYDALSTITFKVKGMAKKTVSVKSTILSIFDFKKIMELGEEYKKDMLEDDISERFDYLLKRKNKNTNEKE